MTKALTLHPTAAFIAKWLVIASCIGVCVGTASAGFLFSLSFATDIREANPWLIAFLPLAGFVIALFYRHFGVNVERGNNLLIETIHEPRATIPFRMGPMIWAATVVTHLFGGSAGREGTGLQLAGSIADQWSGPLGLRPDERKILMISAIAAGFGSVFGTPLAGAVFALEVFMLGSISYEAIFPAFASAIIADLIARAWGAPHIRVALGPVPELTVAHFLYAVAAGVVFGLAAALFCKSMVGLSKAFKKLIPWPLFRPVVGGLLVALAALALGSTRYLGLGLPVIAEAFTARLAAHDFALKLAFTVVTLASGFKGGEVTPLFFIGATLGNALAWIIPLPFGLLASMGYVAVFAGASNTPLACIILSLELFGAGSGTYAAVACVVAYLISGHNSIYVTQLKGRRKHHENQT